MSLSRSHVWIRKRAASGVWHRWSLRDALWRICLQKDHSVHLGKGTCVAAPRQVQQTKMSVDNIKQFKKQA